MNSSPLDLSTPSASSSPGAADASTASHLTFLVCGLIAFAVVCAAPTVLMTWVFTMIYGSIGVAELLERTRGLAPTTYGGAFWLAVTITVVMGGLEIRALLSKAKDRQSFFLRFITRPSTAYWVLIVPTVLLVRIDIKGTDVPDIITTTLLLCCLGYLWFILPLGLGAVAFRLTRWMWRMGTRSGFFAGALGMLGLAFASCVPVVCVVDDDEWRPSARARKAFSRGMDEARGQDAIDGTRAFMGGLAEAYDGGPKALVAAPTAVPEERQGFPLLGDGDTDSERFGECMEKLQLGKPNSLRDKKIDVFVRQRGVSMIDAEQIVDRAMLELCVRHATVGGTPIDKLDVVFRLRAESRLKNWFRSRDRYRQCVTLLKAEPTDFEDPLAVESRAVDRALCELQEIDRRVLELSAMSRDDQEIGEVLGLTRANVRQRRRRALEKGNRSANDLWRPANVSESLGSWEPTPRPRNATSSSPGTTAAA